MIAQAASGPPTITNLTPTTGAQLATVTIRGTNFTNDATVRFNGALSPTVTFVSATRLTAIVPVGATSGRIRVTTPLGTTLSSQTFGILPTLSSFTPNKGFPGSTVTLVGSGFAGTSNVKLGTTSLGFTVVSDSRIDATVSGALVSGTFTVTNLYGTATGSTTFTILPAITAISPTQGAVGSTFTISGSGFTGATNVRVGSQPCVFSVVDDSTIRATVPNGPAGAVTVVTPLGSRTSTITFTPIQPPTITSFSPTSSTLPATVLIRGTRLSGTTSVVLGTQPLSSFTVVSATRVRVVVPTGSTSGRFTVTTPGGSVTSAATFVAIPPPPAGLTYSVNPAVFTVGQPISDDVPSSTGGSIASFAITPALPVGLSFNTVTGIVSGTPTAISAMRTYTVTATNISGSTSAALRITVNDAPPSGLAYATNPAVYIKGQPIPNNTPSANGGAVVSYAITPSLPAGLSFNATTGVISGTPASIGTTSHAVAATNSGGTTTATVVITVNDAPPSALTYSTNPAVCIKGHAITNNTPTHSGGVVTAYSSTPLPPGLSLDPTTGVISGIPTTITASASYIVTASNVSGSTMATLVITINDESPSALSYSTNPAHYVAGQAIADNTPTNSGGAVTLYTVDPALPAGLVLDSMTGVISGSPSVASPPTNYIITATNSGGTTTTTLSIEVKAVLVSIAITPAAPNVPLGLSIQLVAVGTYSDGSTSDLSALLTWSSSASASVTNTGFLTGSSIGSATVTATDPETGLVGEAQVTIGAAIVASLAITPIPVSLRTGTTQQLVAIATMTDGTTTDQSSSVVWSSSNAHAYVGSTGVVIGVSVGGAVITATDPATGVFATANVDVLVSTNDDAAQQFTGAVNPIGNWTYGWESAPGAGFVASAILSGPGVVPDYIRGDDGIGLVRAEHNNSASPIDLGSNIVLAPGDLVLYPPSVATDRSRSVCRWTAPVDGTFQVEASFRGNDAACTTHVETRCLGRGCATSGAFVGPGSTQTYTYAYDRIFIGFFPFVGLVFAGIPYTANVTCPSSASYCVWDNRPYNCAPIGIGESICLGTGLMTAYTSVTTCTHASSQVGTQVLHNGSSIFSREVQGSATAAFTTSLALRAGDTLDFEVDNLGISNGDDPISFDAHVSTCEEVGRTTCGTTCADLTSDVEHCGACDNACDATNADAATCTAGICVLDCSSGYSPSGNRCVVDPPLDLAYATNPVVYTVGETITTNVPTSAGGPITSFAVSPALPPGLSIDGTSGAISGTPTIVAATTDYTIIATNASGSISTTLALTVNDIAPSDLTYANNPAVYTSGTTIFDNIPSSTGGAVVSYAVFPPLPPGLALDSSTGVVSGTPTLITPPMDFTIVATNSGGTASAMLTLTVNDAPPTMLAYGSNPAVYTVGVAIIDNTPSTSGGVATSYACDSLPPGLVIDPVTGVISGTPTTITQTATYTVIASNVSGSTTASLVITVNDVAPSSLAYLTNPASYIVGRSIDTNIPSNSGGAAVTYAIAPALPPGLVFDSATGRISGTPTAVSSTADYTVTATNSGGFATTMLSLTVTSAELVSITISPPAPNVPLGRTTQLTALGTYTDGSTADLTDSVEWSSSTTDAAISTTGLVTGVAIAIATITATDPSTGITASVSVSVIAAVVQSLAITPAAVSIRTGLTHPLSAIATMSDGTTTDQTLAVSWSSSSGHVFVANDGVVTAVSVGGATITAMDPASGATASASVDVSINTNDDAATQFSPYANPIGNWSLGWESAPGAGFNVHARVTRDPDMWQSADLTGQEIFAAHNGATSPQTFLESTLAPGTLVLVPPVIGDDDARSDCRWTAPVDGTFQIDARFEGQALRDCYEGQTTSTSCAYFGCAPSPQTVLAAGQPITTPSFGGDISATCPTSVGGHGVRYCLYQAVRYTCGGIFGSLFDCRHPYLTVVANAYGCSTESTTATVAVLHNGAPIHSSAINTGVAGNVQTFVTSMRMAAGDTLDFEVGNGGSTNFHALHDVVGLDASVATCTEVGLTDCGDTCAALDADANNCGACGTVCSTEHTASSTCDAGVCSVVCATGYSLLDGVCVVDAPSGLLYVTNPAAYTIDVPITTNAPSISGGPVAAFTVSPPLPDGLALDSVTGAITGTPTTLTASTVYTVTATNASGAVTTSLTIAIIDVPPSTLVYATNPIVATLGQPIADDSPTTSGGAVVTFAASPSLPAGLVLDPVTGTIFGTPTEIAAMADYVIIAENSGGATSTTVTITVNDVAPDALVYSPNPATLTLGQDASLTPSSSGGTTISYVVIPSLPTGLVLDPSTGVISGVPTVLSPPAEYLVIASNTGGTTTTTLTIAINDMAPSSLQYAVNPATYTLGQSISINTPSHQGGAIVTYSIDALPPGLVLDPTTGVVSGTPSAITPMATYVVTATNTGGTTTTALAIAVNDVAPSTLAYSTNPALYAVGTPIPNNSPTSSGGMVLSYSITPALPPGLDFDPLTGIISGTPEAVMSRTTFVVAAANSGGVALATLIIAVHGPNVVTSISVGFQFTCVVVNDGAQCWGNNPYGQLGNGDELHRPSRAPVAVKGLPTGVEAIAAGAFHACAIVRGGVRCWGQNLFGQLGNGTITNNEPTPVEVPELTSGVTAIASGLWHTCAVKDGGVWCWGQNQQGQTTPTPIAVPGVESGVLALAAGRSHTCAMLIDEVRCWGYNHYGQLGDGTYSDSTMPVAVQGLGAAAQAITAGEYYTCAVSNGGVRCWGSNQLGQLGAGSAAIDSNTPLDVMGWTSEVDEVSAGYRHACARRDGEVACWGSNQYGQLGDETYATSFTPTMVSGLSNVDAVDAGIWHTCALVDGGVWCWGLNADYQLGSHSSAESSPTPVPVDGWVVLDEAPSDLTYSTNPAVYRRGEIIANNVPTSQGDPATSYVVVPALPEGLVLDPSTGVISGTPTQLSSTTSYTITATNSGGATTAALTLTVVDVPPASLTYSTNPAHYTVGEAIEANLPSSTGGAVTLYAVVPGLPAGLVLDPSTGVLSGTPTASASTLDYSVIGSNSGGIAVATLTITVVHTIQTDPQNCGAIGHDCLGGACDAGVCQPVAVVANVPFLQKIGVDATHVYWTHYVADGSLFAAGQDGSAARTVVSYPGELKSFALDQDTTFLAYTTASGGEIARIATNATDATPSIVATSPYALDVAFDSTNVYWPDDTTPPSSIWVAPRTGTGAPGTTIATETDASTTETRVANGMVFYSGTNGLHWVPAVGGASTLIAFGNNIDVDATNLYWLEMFTDTPAAYRLALTDLAATPTPLVTFASTPNAISYRSDRLFTTSDTSGVRTLSMTTYDGTTTVLATRPVGTNYWSGWFSSIAVTPSAVFFTADDTIWKVAR